MRPLVTLIFATKVRWLNRSRVSLGAYMRGASRSSLKERCKILQGGGGIRVGVNAGNGVVVGADAVVKKNVPARVVRVRQP